ncbi:MAG: hypothetical protein WB535_08925 [Paenarthrobacter sp.]
MSHADLGLEPALPESGFLAALTYIDGVGFHRIATTLIAAGPAITRNWAALVSNARNAVAVTIWPDALRPAAERFIRAADKLAAVSDRGNTTPVTEPAKELDSAALALSNAGWAYLVCPAVKKREEVTRSADGTSAK